MTQRPDKKLIGGHRGSPKKEKENTIKSFKRAILDGADFIEFDVRRSKDGCLVIHHDASISGMCLKDLKLSEINRLAFDQGYEVPVLEDVLRHCLNSIMLDVEIKEPDITSETIKQILRYYSPDGFMITSFFDEALMIAGTRYSGIKKGLLFDKDSSQNLEKRIVKLKPDFILPHFSIFDQNIKDICIKFNLPAILWTVNDEKSMKQYISDPSVAGIISDYPEKALKIFRKT